MKQDFASQELGHRAWSIVRLFYKSRIAFRDQYDSYDDKVIHLAKKEKIPREALRLRAAELAGLLDFKSLEALRDGHILELKELCHKVFRTKDHTDPLDRLISDIFHEISILKEEHYTVKTYAPLYEAASANVELNYILDEAHAMFPQKLGQVLFLFGKAQERLEQHLPTFGGSPIFIRSLFLERGGFVSQAYPDGLQAFYRIMYPCSALAGFYHVGESFYHSGFFSLALESFQMAEAEYEEALAVVRRWEASQSEKGADTGPEVEKNGDGVRDGALGGDVLSGDGSPARPTIEAVRKIMRSLRAKMGRIRRLHQPAISHDSLEGTPPSDLN